MRIGILGGTFNPIHNGHIKIGQMAKQEYHLDKVIFLTSGNPPHKRNKNILDASIRHIMVKKAIEGIDGFEADDYEVKCKEYSYTLYTLMHYKEIYPDDELYFIIGGDSFRDFHLWHKPDEILKLCHILVYGRDDVELTSDFAQVIHGELMDISSTQIRQMVKDGEDIGNLVPECVENLIQKYRIYASCENYEEVLRELIDEKRFVHSIGVRDMAVKLAKIYGVDERKAEIAGLLHDNAKRMDCQLERCEELEAEVDEIEKKNPALLHAKLGAETAKCIFGICDKEIIEAIKWHTIGKQGMSLLEKIVFVADLVEENRTYPDAKLLRELAAEDIHRALQECVRATIDINKKRGVDIHPNAYLILGE